jgi:hypothetical protein
MNNVPGNFHLFQENKGKIKTRVGAVFLGSHVIFRGYNLHTELKDMSWFELYVFGITGRRFSKEQLKLMEAMWMYTSYPDARLWNNRIASLAGSSRSTGSLGISSALAVSEAHIYGGGLSVEAITFLYETDLFLKTGKSLSECILSKLASMRRIAGYGRPLSAREDERNQHILGLAKELTLDKGHYLNLAFQVSHFLIESRYRMKINYGGLAAALAADLGFSAHEYAMFGYPAFLAGICPCFSESASKAEGVIYPASCADIVYEGNSRRSWYKSKTEK